MEKVIYLNKTGYDPFIDFIKAFAILGVLAGHTFPYLDQTGYFLWYGMQVPLFVLIQVFHVLKKEKYIVDFKKLSIRIFVPFLLVQSVFIFQLLCNSNLGESQIVDYIIGGGKGPGSYYPWIFLQIAILLPIARPCLQKGTILQKTLIAIILCEGLEMMSSFINIPDFVYRLLAVRYVFLIFLGWLWVERGIVLNWKTVSISLLSLMSIVYFEYFYQPDEPWFFDTTWKCHRWPCFYYVSTLLCGLLYYLYYKIKRIDLIVSITKLLARCSYEIFLVQMLVIPILSQVVFVENKIGQYVIMTVLVFISSIIGGYYFNRIYNKVVLKLTVNK